MEGLLKPEIRFPEFSEDWTETKFGNHYTFKKTNSFSREKLNYENGEVKNVHYGDIHTKFNLLFDINKESVPFINDDEDLNGINEENYVQNGDIIIADASEDYKDIGKSIEVIDINNERVLAGLHTFLARREDDEIAQGFFAFLLTTNRVRLEIMRIAQGTKVLGLSKNRFSNVKLFIPKHDEQEKIASFLQSVDKRIQLLKEKKDALEDYKKSVLQKLFSQEIRFKQDDGSNFPDWIEKRVDDVFNITRGNVLAVSEMKQEVSGDYIYPVFSSQTKNNGLIGYYNSFLYENAITWTTDGANAGEVNYREGKFYSTNVCGVLLSENKEANYCVSEILNRVTDRYVSYVGNPKLMNNVMAGVKIELPHISEQIKISNFIESLNKRIKKLESRIQDNQLFKKSLLQKMFI